MRPLETLNAIRGSAAILPARRLPVLGDRPGIEQCQRVVQSPVLRPGFLAPAGHIENEAEDLPTDFFDRGVAGRDASSVDVDQVRPAFCQRGFTAPSPTAEPAGSFAGHHIDHGCTIAVYVITEGKTPHY
jgi:hypothetical protein